jgi:hypothetical protein
MNGSNPHAATLVLLTTGNYKSGSSDDLHFLEKPIKLDDMLPG